MSKIRNNQYRYLVTKRPKDTYNFVTDDIRYEVIVKAQTIQEADWKAAKVGEIEEQFAARKYLYRIELLEVQEL